MPWIDDFEPIDAGARTWKIALKNALLKRVSGEEIKGVLRELAFKHPIAPGVISHILLGFRARDSGTDDPLVFAYAKNLLDMKTVGASDLLTALLDTSRFAKQTEPQQNQEGPNAGLPTCEERMFNMLTQYQMTTGLISGPTEAHGLVLALTRWMHAVAEYEMGKQLEDGALHSADIFSFGMHEALASLVFTVFSSEVFRKVAKLPWWKKRRATVVNEMVNFDRHVLQWMQSQLGGRLGVLTNMPPFVPTDSKDRPIFTDQQILQAIPELPVVNSRAGLYVWLNACLCSRPQTDDVSMLTYLQARYPGNNQALAVDLLVASFDVFTNALLRRESEHSLLVIKSFICNKVPLLLNIVSGYMAPPMTVEACIQMAFMSISMEVIPPITAGSNEVREKLKLTRLESLQACALHGLISESTISMILQEPPISLPRVTKYNKDNLVLQCTANVARLEPLIDELIGMAGNAGAIAVCIVETINSFCMNKDTMSLKTVCNMLIKKIPSLDIMMQYSPPGSLLLPLCTQLNNWTHDQDQTEFTPAYEEFASILLFVFAVVHRYGLSRSELGLTNEDSFVVKILRDTAVSKLPGDLTEEQNTQLAKWLEALYAIDEQGESSGISDEVMRQCPPQDFYQLVPTLFEQSVLACKSGALSIKTFKGGLDFLVEPFLLPTLVGGLSWVIKHSWEDHGDAETLLQILDKLIKPSSSSQETKAMHRAILGIAAKPLYDSLQDLSLKQPEKKEVIKYMEIFKPYLDGQRSVGTTKAELDEWVSTPDGGIARCIRDSIRELVLWISSVGPTPPPKYTHRLFVVGCKQVGATAVQDAIIAELKDQTNTGNGAVALDVCCAMVCASLSTSQAPLVQFGSASQQALATPGIRDTVRLSTSNVQRLLHIPAGDAEALVRLSRRVDAQLAVTQIPQMSMAMPMQDQTTDQVMADLGLTDEALGASGIDSSMDQIAALDQVAGADFSNADLNAVMDLANASSQNPLQPDPSQNIFADLDMEMTQPPQQMLNTDGINMTINTDTQLNEDDIFAGLDMDGIGDDFSFS